MINKIKNTMYIPIFFLKRKMGIIDCNTLAKMKEIDEFISIKKREIEDAKKTSLMANCNIMGNMPVDNYDRLEKVNWEATLSEDKEIRGDYWNHLYQNGLIALADSLKCISSTYLSNGSGKIYNSENIEDIFNHSLLIEDQQSTFDKFVKNKSVRLRGPTTKTPALPLENENQLTITLNSCEPNEYADISYYSSTNFRKFLDQIELLLREDRIKFAVVDSKLKRFNISEDIKGRVISTHRLNKKVRVFDARILGVQRVVYDLICRGVNKIEIEGVSLYSKLPYHNKDYKYQITSPGEDLFTSWSTHDVIFNFCFLKASTKYSGTDIKIIDEFSYLLGISKEEYIKILVENIKTEFKGK